MSLPNVWSCVLRHRASFRRRVRITALALGILLFWGTAAEAQFTIMPLGDSYTWGAAGFSGETVPGGYRTRLGTGQPDLSRPAGQGHQPLHRRSRPLAGRAGAL